jgi:hypothetical protein
MLANILKGASSARSVKSLSQTRIVSSVSTYTFNNVSFDSPATDRHIVIVSTFISASGIVHSSSTIGGISATGVVVRPSSTAAGAIYFAKVPTGTSGTIVVNMSGVATELTISVFSISGMGNITGTGNSNGLTGTPASISTTLNTQSNGVVIASARRGGSSIPDLTASNNTLGFSETYSTSSLSQQYRAGYFFPAVTATPDTFSSTSASATGTMTLMAAHFI